MNDVLAELQEANQQRMNRLGPVANPILMLKERLDFLTDLLVGEEGEARQAFEVKWEEYLAERLDELEAAARRLQILGGDR